MRIKIHWQLLHRGQMCLVWTYAQGHCKSIAPHKALSRGQKNDIDLMMTGPSRQAPGVGKTKATQRILESLHLSDIIKSTIP